MFERFTDRSRKVMALANQEAHRFSSAYIGTEHILLGLVKEGSGVAAHVLKVLGCDLRKVRLETEKYVNVLTTSIEESQVLGKLPETPAAKKLIEYAIEEARNLKHNYVGTEHLLLGLLREKDGNISGQILQNLGIAFEKIREDLMGLLAAQLPLTEDIRPILAKIRRFLESISDPVGMVSPSALDDYIEVGPDANADRLQATVLSLELGEILDKNR